MTRYHFAYTNEELKKVTDAWHNEIITKPNKNMFLETYVTLPKDTDACLPPKELIIVDIGGSYLKICVIKVMITGEFEYVLPVEKFSMKEYSHSNTKIWIWIANLLKKFISKLPEREIYGSLTISYPVKHISLTSGTILDCGKNFPFDKNSFMGKDPLVELNSACKSKKIPVSFKTIMNDATATAISSYFTDKSTVLGIVLGTGTNGAIIVDKGPYMTVVNSEWASFEHDSIILTVFDEIVCNNMRENEIYFNLLDVLLGGYKIVEICKLFCKYKGLDNVETITLEEMIISASKNDDDKSKREEIISKCYDEIKTRTAQILAALILGTLKALNPKERHVTVCLNGSIFEHHRERVRLHDELIKLVNSFQLKEFFEIKISFIPDGSLVGCAFSLFLD
ncbi:hypothetical protein H312_00569 [Anncaliia algerae PRA339]|uniref:Phosphotransferase n=1 Tax=Anncaliia algerae PRA339 TaxID=1288291 RepID=A0A059F575_9MICR|nr:hypothetical protein H312_00569 [Anncaliia algerae PRA339]